MSNADIRRDLLAAQPTLCVIHSGERSGQGDRNFVSPLFFLA